MKQKKNSLLDKIVKKDYNNELEEILETKKFDENVKSTLLSILYKIEATYKDLETVKQDVPTKDEYITKILNIIRDNCNSIKILKMSDTDEKISSGKTYYIDKIKGEIISYPIERKILYAISKLGKRDIIIKDDYLLINETLSDLINVGNNVDMVETIRDFNGYSWTIIPQEFESIEHNLIYQNLRMLVGCKFLEEWIINDEFIIDYFDSFKEKIEEGYGKENRKKIVDLLLRISVLLSVKYTPEKMEKYIEERNKIKKELDELENKEKFVEKKTKRKREIARLIKNIDKVINNKKLLQEEYEERNEKLPLEKKIFSMRILSKILLEERETYLKELEYLNEILNPHKFLKYKRELENKYEYLKLLNIEDIDEKLDKYKVEFQKAFLDCIEVKINTAETKQEIEKILYDFRYYLLIPYSISKTVQDEENLAKKISKIYKLILKKAIELKAIEKVSKDEKTNYQILKNIFYVRIIKLEDAYLKITKEKEKFYVQIFDENIFEEKVEIQNPKELEIKFNKKISIMSH